MGRGRLVALLVAPVLLGLLGMHAFVGPVPVAVASMVSGPVAGSGVPAATGVPTGHGDTAGHGEPGGHGDHGGDAVHLLHLCLAVLAAVGAVLLVLRTLGRAVVSPWVEPARSPVRATPPARPPPVPRRLARLCVLRN